jgi:hypothetical protein
MLQLLYDFGRIGLVLFLSGCVSTLPVKELLNIGPQPTLSQCTTLFSRLDKAVAQAETRDSQAAPIVGFPYLRSDRFLASFRDKPLSDSQFVAWLDRLQQRGEEGRKVEMDNLPQLVKLFLPPYQTVQQCGNLLRRHDFSQSHHRQKLRESIQVPSEYQTWKRVLGLYWITAWAIKLGVHNLHDEILETYRIPLAKLKVEGELIRYLPPEISEPLNAQEIRAIIQRSASNPLAIPEPSGRETERLFAAFAPIWQVDTLTNDDRIGAPAWLPAQDKPGVDTNRPTVYRHLSHTWFHGKILLQLNYIVWFPARPSSGALDIVGGHLDGLTWRVTLSPEGTPLAYDTIHNCGCYHLFYTTNQVCLRSADGILQEPPFSPQQAPELGPGQAPTLRIAHTTHFIDRVSKEPLNQGQTLTYQWADYQSLRSLSLEGGQRRSLFQPDGIVPGTQRAERWILWPMGIPGPGEMRQWGHHATAFFGERHFDDPNLMERSLERRNNICRVNN